MCVMTSCAAMHRKLFRGDTVRVGEVIQKLFFVHMVPSSQACLLTLIQTTATILLQLC